MNLANGITFVRVLAIPLFLSFLFQSDPLYSRYFAGIAFSLIALLDAVDGFLARWRHEVTDFGKLVDPLADKLLIFSGLIVLVEKGLVSSIPVIIILAREMIVMGLRVATSYFGSIIAASLFSKWKTFCQMLAVLMFILAIPYAAWVLWLAVILTLLSAVEYFRNFGFFLK